MHTSDSINPSMMRRGSHEKWLHQFRIWGNVRADLVRRSRLGRQETRISNSKHTFLMNVAGVAREGEDFVDGRRLTFSARPPGSLIYIPARSEWHGWDDGDPIASYLLVSIEHDFAERALGSVASYRLAELPPSFGFRDGAIELALNNIIGELKYPDVVSGTMVESQAAQLFVRLLRLSGIETGEVRGGLSPFDLKRAVALITALAVDRLRLEDVAKEFDLSARHFQRAFKESTGLTPHAYLARHRLLMSADMLRFTKSSATEIAHECGFGSSSNFTIAFKRAYGQSPSQFRRNARR